MTEIRDKGRKKEKLPLTMVGGNTDKAGMGELILLTSCSPLPLKSVGYLHMGDM